MKRIFSVLKRAWRKTSGKARRERHGTKRRAGGLTPPQPKSPVVRPDRRTKVSVLVVGASHTNAVELALQEAPDAGITVCHASGARIPRSAEQAHRLYGRFDPEIVVLMIGGNHHHAVGLLEGPEPFDFESDEVPGIDLSRRIIGREEARAALLANAQRAMSGIVTARSHFPDVPMAYLASPPPVSNSEHIVKYLRKFGKNTPTISEEMLRNPKITPAKIRLKLYRLQLQIFKDFSSEKGMDFIFPPEAALDHDGFLAWQYRKNDPTHANVRYGHLVLDTIREYAALVRSRRDMPDRKAAVGKAVALES